MADSVTLLASRARRWVCSCCTLRPRDRPVSYRNSEHPRYHGHCAGFSCTCAQYRIASNNLVGFGSLDYWLQRRRVQYKESAIKAQQILKSTFHHRVVNLHSKTAAGPSTEAVRCDASCRHPCCGSWAANAVSNRQQAVAAAFSAEIRRRGCRGCRGRDSGSALDLRMLQCLGAGAFRVVGG